VDARRAEEELQRDRAHLREILAILRTRTRHDFTGYRKPTLLRRIQRRMSLAALTRLPDYSAMLRERPEEVMSLANDLMINVTGFFRDPEAWEALRVSVIGPLCASKRPAEPIRAWVAACASGEEAYTLAILLAEELSARGNERTEVKIFATDTAEKSLALARAGVFPGGIEADVSPERLERFFDKDEHTYRVKKEIRDKVVFAPQDILRDPPFSRVDLCTCRNLLIYLEPETQRRVISLLHFALGEGGYLFWGTPRAPAMLSICLNRSARSGAFIAKRDQANTASATSRALRRGFRKKLRATMRSWARCGPVRRSYCSAHFWSAMDLPRWWSIERIRWSISMG